MNRRLLQYIIKTNKKIIFSLVLILIATAFQLIAPQIVSNIINIITVEKSNADLNNIYFLIILYFCSSLIFIGITFFARLSFSKLANEIVFTMQKEIFEHVQNLPISYFDTTPVGKTVSRITNDTSDIRDFFNNIVLDIFTAAFFTLGVFIIMPFINIYLFLIAASCVPFLYLIMKDHKTKSNTFNAIYRKKIGELNASLNEDIHSIDLIKSFNKEEYILNDFMTINKEIYEQNVNITHLDAYNAFNLTFAMNNLVIIIVLFIFGYSNLGDKIGLPLGQVYVFIFYLKLIFEYSRIIASRISEIQKASVAANNIFKLLDTKATYDEYKEYKATGEIEFKNVSFEYKQGENVLQNISFKIKPEETVAFVGHTGSGKSTIANLILGYYKINDGEILVDGNNLHDISIKGFRENISVVLQDAYLFKGTIKSNISLDNKSISDEDCANAFRRVGGDIIKANHPKGIHSVIDYKGSTFSEGEKQLIVFARALAKNPSILILDEATANIDSETEKYVQRSIEELKKGRTTIIIAHRLSTIKNADMIYVLDKGNIIESGNHDELIKLGGTYKEMYLSQSNDKNMN